MTPDPHALHGYLRNLHLSCTDQSEYQLSTKQSCLTPLVSALFSRVDRTVSIHTIAVNIHYFFDTPNHIAANLAYWSNPPAIQKVDLRFTPVGHQYTHSDPSFTYNLRRTPVLYLSSTMMPQNSPTQPVSIRPYWHIPDQPENQYPFYRTLIDFFMKIPVTCLYFSFINPPGFPIYLEQYADTFFEVVY